MARYVTGAYTYYSAVHTYTETRTLTRVVSRLSISAHTDTDNTKQVDVNEHAHNHVVMADFCVSIM